MGNTKFTLQFMHRNQHANMQPVHAPVIKEAVSREEAEMVWDSGAHPIGNFHAKARSIFNHISPSHIMADFRGETKHMDLIKLSQAEQDSGLYTRFPSPGLVDGLTKAENEYAKEKYQAAMTAGMPVTTGDKLANAASYLGVRTGMGRIAMGLHYQSHMGYMGTLMDEKHPEHARTASLHSTMDPSAGF